MSDLSGPVGDTQPATDDDFQDRGEPWRQMFGIDGTAGDAQDVPHPFVPDAPGGCCVVCGLARSYRRHTGDFDGGPNA